MLRTAFCGVSAAIALTASVGCTPTVAVQAPKEPITINMNIKIEHEVRVRVDKDLDQLLEKDKDLF
jgi:YnbE-like lipoprotein